MAKDYYQILGLEKGASEDDIKKAYRALAKQYHPDKNKEAGAEEKFKEIGKAYETLKDKDSRQMYDVDQAQAERERKRNEMNRERSKNQKDTGDSSGSRFKYKSDTFHGPFKFETHSSNGSADDFHTFFFNNSSHGKKQGRGSRFTFTQPGFTFTFFSDDPEEKENTKSKKKRHRHSQNGFNTHFDR